MDERNSMGKDKMNIIIDLVSFYQEFVKKLKLDLISKEGDIRSKQTIVDDENFRNRDLEKEVRNLKYEAKDLHEDKLEALKRMTAVEMQKRDNDDRVKQIEAKYQENV